jgi:endonuclease YncB( thermonuclease family)
MGAMKGLLRITGTIDLSQFWPNGTSDTDTATVVVNPDGFEFSADGSLQALRRTRVFEGAQLAKKDVIHPGRKMTIRIQGIDAPELHCSPGVQKPAFWSKAKKKKTMLKGNGGKFRQFQGETSAAGLAGGVGAKPQPNVVPCEVTTRINVPNDVFDMYGRLVGDISFRIGGKIASISHLAAQNGWALPAYYNSMNPDEILTLQGLFEEARKKKRGIWPHFERAFGHLKLLQFEHLRTFTRKARLADRGPFAVPKIYRRQLRYSVLLQNDLAPKTFKDYLAGKPLKGETAKGSRDAWATRVAILANPTMKKPTKAPHDSLAGLLSAKNAFPAGAGISQPGDIVFFEQPSTLRKKNGTPITEWKLV